MPTVRTAKHLLLESTTKSVESGTYDVTCQFCTVKGIVVESEILKAQNCALSKISLPVHSNGYHGSYDVVTINPEIAENQFTQRVIAKMQPLSPIAAIEAGDSPQIPTNSKTRGIKRALTCVIEPTKSPARTNNEARARPLQLPQTIN